MSARISPVAIGTRPELAELEAKITAKRGRITPLYQYLLNSPAMCEGWEELLSAVRQKNSLSPALRELIILRVAVLNRAPYEFDVHAPIALKEGLSQAKIDAAKELAISAVFDEIERVVLTLIDTMTREVDVPDSVFAPVHEHFQGQALLDLCITISAYNMVSRLLGALRIH